MAKEPTPQPSFPIAAEATPLPEPTVTRIEKDMQFDLSGFVGIDHNARGNIQAMIHNSDDAFTINCGNKTLLLYFRYNWCRTYLFSDNSPKIPGATTKIYSRAKELMQDKAKTSKTGCQYFFETRNTAMKEWAKSEGTRIFNWEREHSNHDNPFSSYEGYTVEIPPENQEAQ